MDILIHSLDDNFSLFLFVTYYLKNNALRTNFFYSNFKIDLFFVVGFSEGELYVMGVYGAKISSPST